MFSLQNRICGQNSNNELGLFRDLGDKLYKKEQYFYSYLYNLSFMIMSEDSVQRRTAGLQALRACIKTGHLEEAEFIMGELSSQYPDLIDKMQLQYSFGLSKKDEFDRSNKVLSSLDSFSAVYYQARLLSAYNNLNLHKVDKTRQILLCVPYDTLFGNDVRKITDLVENPVIPSLKKQWIAVPLSCIVPGSGLAYCGLTFDALQSFGFCTLFALSTYTAWKYELQKPHSTRTYILPAIPSAVFGIFYAATINATINGVYRANEFSLNRYYTSVLRLFENIFNDKRFIDFDEN